MQYFFQHLLEPVSYFIYAATLFWQAKQDHRATIVALSICYTIMGTLTLSDIYIDRLGLKTNLQFYTLSCVICSVGLGFYFSNILETKWKSRAAIVLVVINSLYYAWYNILNQVRDVFDSMGFVLLSASVVVMIFLYMHQLLTNIKEDPLSGSFDFWFISSLLVYYLGAFAIFLTFGYFTRKLMHGNDDKVSSGTLTNLWGIHNVLLFLSSLTTAMGAIWISRHKKSLLS